MGRGRSLGPEPQVLTARMDPWGLRLTPTPPPALSLFSDRQLPCLASLQRLSVAWRGTQEARGENGGPRGQGSGESGISACIVTRWDVPPLRCHEPLKQVQINRESQGASI